MKLAMISVPYCLDQYGTKSGRSPAAFRAAGLADRLAGYCEAYPTWTDVTAELTAETPAARIGQINAVLADVVAAARADGVFPLILAGDCTACLGALSGLRRDLNRVGIVWFDAHGDFNTWETTPSGFLGGMPLAMAVGRGEQTIAHGAGLTRPVAESDVWLVDGRNLDPEEAEAVASSGLTHVPTVADLAGRPLPDAPIYLHFDVDVLDKSIAPGVSYPEPNGPSLEQAIAAVRDVIQRGDVVVFTMAAVNVDLDTDGRTLAAAVEVIETAVAVLAGS